MSAHRKRPARTDDHPSEASHHLRGADKRLAIAQEYVSATNVRGDAAAQEAYAVIQQAIDDLEQAQEVLE